MKKILQKFSWATMDEKSPASIYYKAIIVNFEQISHIVMVFPLLTLNK